VLVLLLQNGYRLELERYAPLDLALRSRRWDLFDLLNLNRRAGAGHLTNGSSLPTSGAGFPTISSEDDTERRKRMAHKGKIQLLITFVATPDKVAEVDRLVASHGAWMAEGHHRQGPKALLSYNFSKGPELKNPLDPASAPTGNTRYVLNEIYESPAGIADHWQQSQKSWRDFPAMAAILGSCNPQTLHGGVIAQSLW